MKKYFFCMAAAMLLWTQSCRQELNPDLALEETLYDDAATYSRDSINSTSPPWHKSIDDGGDEDEPKKDKQEWLNP